MGCCAARADHIVVTLMKGSIVVDRQDEVSKRVGGGYARRAEAHVI